jgi:GxxExxY protein
LPRAAFARLGLSSPALRADHVQGIKLATPLRLDLLVAQKLVVDVKSKEEITPIDKQQMRTYLKLSGHQLGLIMNFNIPRLIDGITRVVYRLKEPPPKLHAGPIA